MTGIRYKAIDIRTVRNAENNDDQCPAFREGNEGGTEVDLSPEKAMRTIDTFGVDSVTNDDITVNIRDSAGVSDELRCKLIN